MTAHELAAKLLSGPDNTVCFWEYVGGPDELREIKDVEQDETGAIVLYAYVKE